MVVGSLFVFCISLFRWSIPVNLIALVSITVVSYKYIYPIFTASSEKPQRLRVAAKRLERSSLLRFNKMGYRLTVKSRFFSSSHKKKQFNNTTLKLNAPLSRLSEFVLPILDVYIGRLWQMTEGYAPPSPQIPSEKIEFHPPSSMEINKNLIHFFYILIIFFLSTHPIILSSDFFAVNQFFFFFSNGKFWIF